MIWNRDAETATRAAMRALADQAAAGERGLGPRARALLSRRARRGRRDGRGGDARPPRGAAVHGEGRPAPALPVRALRGAARGGDPHPRLLRHPGQAHRGGLHPRTTSGSGERSWRGRWPPRGPSPASSSRSPTATASSPAASASTTAPSTWGSPWCRSPRATRSARSCCSRTSGRRAWPARRPSRSTSARACGSRASDPRALGLALRALRRRAVDRGDARAARGALGLPGAWISTGSARSSAPAWPASAWRPATACTSTRTTSCPRSSTRGAGRRCPPGRRGSWC